MTLFYSLMIIFLFSCSHLKQGTFGDLLIGMNKTEVENILGTSWETAVSASGNGELNHIYKNGYVWYDEHDKLKGFASYTGEDFTLMKITRASGYKFRDSNNKDIHIFFEPFSTLKSDEAKFIYLENKRNIELFFTNLGYRVVAEKNQAQTLIIIRLGISNPDKTQELSLHSTSNSYGSSSSIFTSTNNEYHRSLEFIAKDLSHKGNDDNTIWSTVVVSSGITEDLRVLFPYLFYASSNLVNRSVTHKGYDLAAYHTGVLELVNRPVPRKGQTSPGVTAPIKKSCSNFANIIGSQTCK